MLIADLHYLCHSMTIYGTIFQAPQGVKSAFKLIENVGNPAPKGKRVGGSAIKGRNWLQFIAAFPSESDKKRGRTFPWAEATR